MGSALALSFLVLSCAAPEAGHEETGSDQIRGETGIPLGANVEIVTAGDSVSGGGVLVSVRNPDGSSVLAVFRGPQKFAETVSGGSFEFSGDSLPARVRVLRPGETPVPVSRELP
jgi:hypothetical protein